MTCRLSSACLALLLLIACGDPTTKKSDLCDPEGSICADGTVCSGGACIPCVSSDECGGLACLSGRCRTCTDDFQCGPGRLCKGGTCGGCEKSLDCPLDQACVSSVCVPCASSTDCGDGRACVNAACKACERTSECDGGKVCLSGACTACTETRQCNDGLACVAGACAACSDASQCLAGDICLLGKCGPCSTRSQCPQGEICAAGHCAPCASSDDCDRGEACIAGRCGACQSSDQCATGEICRDGVCGRCGTTAECPGGLICQSGLCIACTTRAQCDPGLVCASGRCRPCADRGECNRGEICAAGHCGPCASANDCAAGEICAAGACGPCASRAQCSTGQVCVQGACRACANQSECASGEACVAGKCGPCASAGDCVAGEGCISGACGPCTASADCRTGEVCRPSTHRCGAPGAPDHLEYVSGQSQRAVVQTRLTADLVVRVVDKAGDPVPNTSLVFDPSASGYGTPGASSVTSGPDGLASTTWRLGPLQGQQFMLVRGASTLPDQARSGRATFTFSATADADVPDHLELLAGNTQSAPAGTVAPTRLQVRVADRWGNGIAQVRLGWTITQGAGSLDATSTTTDADGKASAALTLGRTPGTNEVVVSRTPPLPDVDTSGRATATFRLTGVTGPADHLVKLAGDQQAGAIFTTLPTDAQVRVVDRFENPVNGASLRVTGSAGLTLPSTITANGSGVASVRVQLGGQAGPQSMSIFASPALPDLAGTGRPSVTFSFTTTPGAPDHLELIDGDAQTAVAGTKVPSAPTVRVVDAVGNHLSGVSVRFTPAQGTVAPALVTTGSDGLATTDWTLGLVNGPQTLLAERDGTPLPGSNGSSTITFTATAPAPQVSLVSPSWLPIAGGTLTIDGTNLASDAAVTVAGQAATRLSQTATQLVVAAPSIAGKPSIGAGNQPVVVTSAGTTLQAGNVFYALKFTPKIDGGISTTLADADWPPQSLVGANALTSDWNGSELRELYAGYDDNNFYFGIKGVAAKENAFIAYVWSDGLSSTTRPNASWDIKNTLTDDTGTGAGDGKGCYWQTPSCQWATGVAALSLDSYLSSGFQVSQAAVPGWVAHYAFGRSGNAIDLTNDRHNAVGARDLFNPADFGWSDSTVKTSLNYQEFSIPRTAFAKEPARTLTQLKFFVRIAGCSGQCFPNQSLPYDPNVLDSNTRYVVSKVATLDVR